MLLLAGAAVVQAAPLIDLPGDAARTVLAAQVRDVRFGPTSQPVFEVTGGADYRASAEAVYARQGNAIEGAKILLIDRDRRLWLRPDTDRDQTTIELYDGKAWSTRKVSDIPAGEHRRLEAGPAYTPAPPNPNPPAAPGNDGVLPVRAIRRRGKPSPATVPAAAPVAAPVASSPIHFVGAAVQDSAGSVWFADGARDQGWWLHRFSADGKWSSIMLHERALQGINAPKKGGPPVLDFVEPRLLVGPDGLFYVSWTSYRIDGGQGLGASGFQQFDGSHWSEYFYPTGSDVSDQLQSIIPLPDGSVGFVRQSRQQAYGAAALPPNSNPAGEPRVVWMTSALSRPVPDLNGYIERLSSRSSREREAAQAELIAMGPRVRAVLQPIADQAEDPELQARLPVILQEISKPPQPGVFGGKLTFKSWRFLCQTPAGKVLLAVEGCKDLTRVGDTSHNAVVTVSPQGVWTAAGSPTKTLGRSIDGLDVYEDFAGRRWDRIDKVGVFFEDGKSPLQKVTDEKDAAGTIRGADATGRLYLRTADGVVVLNAAGKE